MTLKISISGIRGYVPESLTPQICLDFAKAFGTYLQKEKKHPKVIIGTDPRASSEFIKGIVFSGLTAAGCQVVDLGICPTPTVGIMVRELKAEGGIIITASHNPLPWNGLKFVRSDGIFLNAKQANQLIKLFETKEFNNQPNGCVISDPTAIKTHIKKVLKVIKPRKISQRKFTVALDCCNGAGSIACVKLLEKLGCRVKAINCNLDQPFPHDPEPVAKNLKELCSLVKEEKADIGFALDSDADRLAIVSEEGHAIGEELTLSLATKFLLQKNKKLKKQNKLVVTNLSTTQLIDDLVKEFQGLIIRTKIGEVHVAEQIKQLKALVGGEGNGGIILPSIGFNRDSLAGMALVLSLLAASKKTVGQHVAELPSYYQVKEKITCDSLTQAEKTIALVKNAFKGKDLILTEGVKVVLPTGWVHVRASNTEPIIRIIAEGKTKKVAQELVGQVLQTLG